MAGLRRPAHGTADPKPASQDVFLSVSKVATNSSVGAPDIGQGPAARDRPQHRRPVYSDLSNSRAATVSERVDRDLAAMAEIWISESRDRRATCTVARAGGLSLKYPA